MKKGVIVVFQILNFTWVGLNYFTYCETYNKNPSTPLPVLRVIGTYAERYFKIIPFGTIQADTVRYRTVCRPRFKLIQEHEISGPTCEYPDEMGEGQSHTPDNLCRFSIMRSLTNERPKQD